MACKWLPSALVERIVVVVAGYWTILRQVLWVHVSIVILFVIAILQPIILKIILGFILVTGMAVSSRLSFLFEGFTALFNGFLLAFVDLSVVDDTL